METIANQLLYWIEEAPARLGKFTEAEISKRPLPNKWSKKEILGHLCDSAVNNYQRFVKIQYEAQPYEVHKYDQNQWVAIQNYQDIPFSDILNLWISLNKQIAAIIIRIPEEKLQHACKIGSDQLETLEWLVRDYLDHMQHHFKQIFVNG